jgi:hypothetical protein
VNVRCFRVSEDSILDVFLSYLEEHCPQRKTNVIFSHNLQFDLTALLAKREQEIFRYRQPPELRHQKATIQVSCQKTWYAKIKLNRNKARVLVLDSANFIKGSLFSISRELRLKTPKPDRPYFVKTGRAPRNQVEWYRLRGYCRAEIMSEYELAQFILSMHEQNDCGLSVSASQLASKVFRKQYLKQPIPQAPDYVRKLAERSLHGGRAGVFVETPTVIPNVGMYDYNSFYSWAMRQLPPITKGEWVRVAEFQEGLEGFYKISGRASPCHWPIVIKSSSSMDYAENERVQDVYIPSYELREALRSGELDLESLEGWVWKPADSAENPFRPFVEDFYRKRQKSPKDSSLRITYKLLLNALYGKTYQAIRTTDYEEEPELVWREDLGRTVRNNILYRAGGLYLPHVGSWITSMARARLHQDLHRYEAIDCATDSFKTVHIAPEDGALGGLKRECRGLLLLVRPKVYVMFDERIQDDVERCGDLREYLRGNMQQALQGVQRYAMHGFWGNLEQLLELYARKDNEYIAEHMTKIRESIRQQKQPRVMETQKRGLHVDWENERGLCGLPKKDAITNFELCNLRCFTCAHSQTF